MKIKLVAIDIDGTLLNDQREITSEVKETIREAVKQGIYIVLCTGRPLPGVKKQVAELELFNTNDYVITYNGSLVQNVKSGEIISRYGLTLADFLEIEYMARKVGSHLHVVNQHAIYTPNRDISRYTTHEAELVEMPLKYRSVEEYTTDMDFVKAMMIDEPAVLNQAIAALPHEFKEKFTTVKSTDFYYEILNKEASKGNAVARLAKHLQIQQDEVMAIGDNENDISMLEYAGMGVAMKNATAEVKAIADAETRSNNDHGVAYALKEYVLK